MILKEVKDTSEFFKKTKIEALIEEFVKMEVRIAEVTGIEEYKNAYSASSTFRHAIERMGLKHIKTMSRKGKAYLINESIMDKE